MWKYGLFIVIFVYAVIFFSLIMAIKITKMGAKAVIGKEDNAIKIAHKQVIYVVLLISIIYLVPIVGMAITIFINLLYMIIIGSSMLLSTPLVAHFIIIPLVERRRAKHAEDVLGKDSEYVKYLKEKYAK